MKSLLIALFAIFSTCEATVRITGDSHSVCSFCLELTRRSGTWAMNYQGKQLSVPFSILHKDSSTMHRVGRDGLNYLNQERCELINAHEGDTVIFVYGEVDCRGHIMKQKRRQNCSIQSIIEKLAANYLKTLIKYKSQYNNVSVVVFNVVPPTNYGLKPPYIRSGTLQQRVEITKQLNSELKKNCDQNGILFLDTYDHYANPDGSMILSLSDGRMHISHLKNHTNIEKLASIINMEKYVQL